MATIYYWFFYICTALLYPLSLAQLTGSIVNLGNPFIINIAITNPTQNTISILRWNNVFDNQTDLPVSFSVKDDQGSVTPFATTYAMHSGMTNSDFYTFSPGQSFSRIYDLRQFLQSIPSGPSNLQYRQIQIIPPTTFQGVSSSGAINVPAEAAADLANGKLGNFAAAGLVDITLQAQPLARSFTFPIYSNVDPPSSIPSDGVQLDQVSCTGQNASDLSDAIADAALYANSAKLAAYDMSNKLFPQFFQGPQRSIVKVLSNLASNALQRTNSYHIDVYCSDLLNLCDPDGSILGYSYTPSFVGSSYIILCPAGRNLGRAPAPCSATSGNQISASASHVMFHLLLTVSNVMGSMISNNYYGAQSCQTLVNSTTVDATLNPDSYAQLAIAQWGYGLGGAPYNGQACLPASGLVPPNQRRSGIVKKHKKQFATKTPSHSVPPRQWDYSPEDAVNEAQACTGAQLTLVQDAAANARVLAAAAAANTDNDLWTQTFNGNGAVKTRVMGVFNAIAQWNTTVDKNGNRNDAGVKFLCDPQRKTFTCRYGTNAATIGFPATQQAYFVFCPFFFNQPAALECESPSSENTNIADMAGSVFHELLHVRWLVNANIEDGFSPDFGSGACYGWTCVTYYAQSRNLPGWDPRNLPEVVASNYEYFAYAARAAVKDCTWTGWIGDTFGLGSLINR